MTVRILEQLTARLACPPPIPWRTLATDVHLSHRTVNEPTRLLAAVRLSRALAELTRRPGGKQAS